jgi:hypothetical protein
MEGSAVTPHPNVVRGPIEEQYNGLRDDIEKQYIQDRNNLEKSYQEDLAANREAKAAALLEAGLNEDGSVPSTYPESSDPVDTVAPTITGTVMVDEILTAYTGTWSRGSTFTYQWERADLDGSNNVPIIDETDSTYILVEDDLGKKVRVKVTDTNEVGSETVASDYTTEVLAASP